MAAILAIATLGSARAAEPIVTTFAGGGTGPAIGDGGPATQAVLSEPKTVETDAAGNVYIAESGWGACRVRRVDAATGIITTFAGNGQADNTGTTQDNVPATSVPVCAQSLAFDSAGNLYLYSMARIRKVTPAGIITTVAGTGTAGYSGDGGQAKAAKIFTVPAIAFDAAGAMYLADAQRIRKVATNGVITTFAGTGAWEGGSTGDGGPATAATMRPEDLVFDRKGNLLLIDSHQYLRRIGRDGIIRRIAGPGPYRNDPLALQSDQVFPSGIAVDAANNLYVSNSNNFIRLISASGAQATFAGVYNDSTFAPYGAYPGFAGDGGPASKAAFYWPEDIAIDAAGNLYVADQRNNRIRRITPATDVPRLPAGIEGFAPRQQWNFGYTWVASVATGDINCDGRSDALILTDTWGYNDTDPHDHQVFWLRQDSAGRLAAPVGVPIPPGHRGSAFLSVDLNHDRCAEVLVGTNEGVAIYRGSHAGVLSPPTVWPGFASAEIVGSLGVGDMDNDGHTDFVAFMAGRSEGGTSPDDWIALTVFRGDGQGGVARKDAFRVQSGSSAKPRLVDVNRDGWLDVIATFSAYGPSGYTSGMRIYLNDGTGGVRAPYDVAAASGSFVAAIAIGDFDSDGLRDFLLARNENAADFTSSGGAAYAHFRELPGGAIVFVRTIRAFDAPSNMEVADFNLDGQDDVVVHHGGWSSVGLMEQALQLDGTSWLDPEVKYWIQTSNSLGNYSMSVADLDSDGCPDVATQDSNHGLQVLRGTCRIVTEGSVSPRVPTIPGKTTGASTGAPTTSASAAPVDGMWAASQRVMRSAWTRTIGVVRRIAGSPFPWSLSLFWWGGQAAA